MKTGAFNGWWLDMAGKKIRRIYRAEYAELYRLLRICRAIEPRAADVPPASAQNPANSDV